MANIDYAALKKGGFMRQKQKGYFSLRLQTVGGNLTAENIKTVAEVAEKYGKGYIHRHQDRALRFLSLILRILKRFAASLQTEVLIREYAARE